MNASDSLLHVPDHISPRFLSNYESIGGKSMEKALSYFSEGYVHDIRIKVSIIVSGLIVKI